MNRLHQRLARKRLLSSNGLLSPRSPTGGRRASVALARCALLATAGVCAVSSCEQLAPSGASDVSDLADRHPEVAAMVEEAGTAPPERVEDGFRLRSAAPAAGEQLPERWKTVAASVEVEVDSTGDLLVRSPHAVVRAKHVAGGPSRHVTRDGSAVVIHDAAGLRSVLLARSTGVEELLVQDADEATGYDLELPRGWSLVTPAGHRGLVEIHDAHARPRLRVAAPFAWDADGKKWPVTVRAAARKIRFEVPTSARRGSVVVDPEWQATAAPFSVRARAAVANLPDGRVLSVGGELSATGDALCTTDIYDPFVGAWEAGPPIPAGEGLPADACTTVSDAVTVPLPDGTILVVGGATRADPDGTPHLVGADQPGAISSAWKYVPATRTFEPTGPMNHPRVHHTATLLPSGKVLVAGGSDRQKPSREAATGCPKVGDTSCEHCVGMASAELYDPNSGTFTDVPMPLARSCHSAHLLADGSVLLVGGAGSEKIDKSSQLWGTPLTALSLYKDGQFTELATSLNTGRLGHFSVFNPARNEILVSLGRNESHILNGNFNPNTGEPVYALSEIIDLDLALGPSPPPKATALACDPDAGEGEGGAGGGGSGDPPCPEGRAYGAATLTHDGQALMVGGVEVGEVASRHVDTVDFSDASFQAGTLPTAALRPVLVSLATGSTLLLGQTVPPRLYDADRWEFSDESPGLMATTRSWHTLTPLPDGDLLIAGGQYDDTIDLVQLDTAELFDPKTMTSTLLESKLSVPRSALTATYLPPAGDRGAKVLLTGGVADTGNDDEKASFFASDAADLYDPVTKSFEKVGSMKHERSYHAAALLPDGRVLVVGGMGDQFAPQASAEIYDPVSREFREVASEVLGRLYLSATVLPTSGKVLLTGGYALIETPAPAVPFTIAEIFDPATETFRRVPDMVVPRGDHIAQALPNGTVLLAGGSIFSTSAELFDPETETFRLATGAMNDIRIFARAIALPSGKVLITGGALKHGFGKPLADGEIYDPLTETFTAIGAGADNPPRSDHRMALLPDGSVALVGGSTNEYDSLMTDRVDVLRIAGEPAGPLPSLDSAPSTAAPSHAQSIAGAGFTSFWETSTGQNPAAANFPTAVWISISGLPKVGNIGSWSSDAATWTPRSSPFHGLGRLFAVRNGQPSTSSVPVELLPAENGVPCDADTACASGFCSDGVCCNERCHVAGDPPESVCRSCSIARGAAQDGVCSNVAENTDPHLDCEESIQCAPDSATCDGAGQCKPCRCSSKIDCAVGYTCTPEGTCERPPAIVPEEGCRFAPRGDAGRSAPLWVVGLLVGLLRNPWGRRRGRTERDHRSVHGAKGAYFPRLPRHPVTAERAAYCVSSNRLRVAGCVEENPQESA